MGINLGSLAPEPAVDIKAQATPAPVPAPLPEGVEKVDRGGGAISLNLKKGISLDLSKTLPTLVNVKAGLGWDSAADLDVFALTMRNGKIQSANDIVFFNNKTVPGIILSGDCRNGLDSTGVDDETITINLAQIPADITEIAIFANIYDGQKLNQNFGMVNGAYIRIVDANTNKEEAIYVLNENDAALFNAFHFATFKRNGTGWTFDTVSKGMNGSIEDIANQFC